jgi:hypothetical protein
MKSLLQRARASKNVREPKPITQEYIDLALAWAVGEITLAQAERAIYGKTGGQSFYVDLARSLKKAITTGQLKVVKK